MADGSAGSRPQQEPPPPILELREAVALNVAAQKKAREPDLAETDAVGARFSVVTLEPEKKTEPSSIVGGYLARFKSPEKKQEPESSVSSFL